MKLLLDENLPHQLRHELPGHNCYSVAYMGWAGVENGELLRRAASEGFEALISKDANLQYEQQLVNLPMLSLYFGHHQTISTIFAHSCPRCFRR
jgi:hypothetical protein